MKPLILTTWSFGPTGNDAAMPGLLEGGLALNAVTHAATVIEADPTIDSVGVGGLPDADGEVSLDACVMTDPHRCGAVMYVQHFANPTQIARKVMEETIHVTLAGEGAESFADSLGFERSKILTPEAKEVWERWRKDPNNIDRDKYRGWLPPINVEELRGVDVKTRPHAAEPLHDTVTILARDAQGKLAGACTTSGMAFKVPGRVGDSPIIGQGLYVDQEAGAAGATGTGEIISGVCGSFLVVELMRRGAKPVDAIHETLERIQKRFSLHNEHQVAFVAMSKEGDWASGALRPGFRHTITDETGSRVEDPTMVLIQD
jgi:isoaspartyl peptidase/L-asparaginase-like protein (Ntn-hydrolase superfamily)